MTRDCRQYRGWPETAGTVQEMTRDCGHSTGDDQRLRTQYRRRPETADTVQEKTRDCGQSTGDDQRLQT
ncbi:unnamed protein product [Staurois parvus]|uniref:Uncharacterized protein n=1 Tax=Staurois parvus TaxID=386267 RepID=A0ABN9EFA5_9NEOB|nr:unnamed protein product [Staurois parvus]